MIFEGVDFRSSFQNKLAFRVTGNPDMYCSLKLVVARKNAHRTLEE
jgi:hypothetical protein